MKRSLRFRAAVVVFAATVLGACSGCTEWITRSNALSFGLGWILRDITAPTTVVRECYLNGALVDCADVL